MSRIKTKKAFLSFLRGEGILPVKMQQKGGRMVLDRVANDQVFSNMVDLHAGDLIPHRATLTWALTYGEGGQ